MALEYALHARTMADYNGWMNEKLYACAAQLTDAERKRDRKAFFQSIHGILNHILVGDRLWFGRFTAEPFGVASLNTELYGDFDELTRQRALTDAAIIACVATLDDAKLGADLIYNTMVNPQQRRTPLWFVVTHFFNHQTHHRGQLTTLLSQAGVDPGVTDLLWLPR